MDSNAYPQPFMIESGGSRYAIVERHNLPTLEFAELLGVSLQALAWIIEALRVDARSDFRKAPDEQAIAKFLCQGNEYSKIRMQAAEIWRETHEDGTCEEFEAQFKIDEIDDSVRQPLPEWWFLIFEEGAEWATENVLQTPGFCGVFYVWNTRTAPEAPEGVWLVSPNPMLAAPTADNEWWLAMFADLMHAMLSYEFPLSDGRMLWLQAWQFPTKRSWLAWYTGEASGFVTNLRQRMIMHGLGLPDPVYVIEERVTQPRPPEMGGGWMDATRRMRQCCG